MSSAAQLLDLVERGLRRNSSRWRVLELPVPADMFNGEVNLRLSRWLEAATTVLGLYDAIIDEEARGEHPLLKVAAANQQRERGAACGNRVRAALPL